MEWSDGLDPESAAYAIAASDSANLRVIAGPGAGKSFAMKRRVARLLQTGVDPKVILPVTFTRVAAEDLHRELVGMQVEGCDQLNGTTLHSLALRTLMRNHILEVTGRTPRPLNEYEVKPLEKDLDVHGGVRQVRRLIIDYESAWATLQHHEPGFAQSPEQIAFSTDLVNWLVFHEAMLIGEVIPQFHEYLVLNPGARERLEYSHVLVDEYQDLNKAEQSTIEMLSDEAEVCIVGDDDQSIYSFKHAHPEGIREWLEGKQGEDQTLLECRRCPTRVVEMANSLIAHNQTRPVPRELLPREENGRGTAEIVQFQTLDAEVEGVVQKIVDLVESGTSPGDILVLAQRGVIGTPIYEGLMEAEVPVRSYYAEAELDSEEAQRRFALLKLYVNQDDRVALRWMLGLGSNNWRSPAYRRIRQVCEEERLSPWEVLNEVSEGNRRIRYTHTLIERFREINRELHALEQLPDLESVIDVVFPEDLDQTHQLRELAVRVLEDMEEDDRVTLLAQLISAIATPEVPSEIEDVRIMSLHKSKGLSAPVTIIAGCVEGLLPMRPDPELSERARTEFLEEQRRLFFVGVSRVKGLPNEGEPGRLILTYSQQMPLADAMGAGIRPVSANYGIANLQASRFIGELGPSAPRPVRG